MRFKPYTYLALAPLALSSMRSFAQFETASIVGRVTDSTGAVVANAMVSVTNDATNITITRKTDKAGQYAVPALQVGTYTIKISLPGFNEQTLKDVRLSVGTNQQVNAQLVPGTSETVTVDSQELQLETASSQKQQVIGSDTIDAFPLLNMNYSDLVQLSAGVVQDAVGQDLGTSSVVREGSYNINGMRSTYNNYLLDGMDNNAHGTSNQGFSNQVINPSQYDLSQFSIVTTIPSAEYGRSAGGTINVAFKTGTNHFHGMLWESFRNTLLNANGYFRATDNSGATRRTTLNRNQFGGNIGGPFLRNKFFFFADYEGVRQARQVVNQANIFTVAQHQLIASPSASNNTTTVMNPFTGATYAADRPLPRSVLSPIALSILDAFPLPKNNGAGAGSISSNWSSLQRFVNSYDKEDARLDIQWSPRMSSFARVSQSKEHDLDGPLLPPPISGSSSYYRTINQQLAFGLTRQVGAAQLLEARLGISYTKAGKMPYTIGDPRTFGIQGIPTDPRIWGGLVTQELAGYSDIGRQSTSPQWQYPFFLDPKVSYSWLVGKHNLKTGYEFNYLRQTVQDVNPIYGDMQYQSSFTGYTFSDFMFGVPDQISMTSLFVAHLRQGGHGAFLQDDWRILPKLTLNIGLRYEYTSHFEEKDSRMTNFDPQNTPQTGQMIRAAASGSAYQKQLIDPDLNDLMPRFGLAFSPNSKLVVHGGYGIGYMHYTRSGEADDLAVNGPQMNAVVYNQIPAYTKLTGVTATSTFYSLDNGFPQNMASPSNFNLYTSMVKWVPRSYRDPYVQSWYVGVQTAIGSKMLADIAYVGNHGVKLQEVGTYNQRRPELGTDAQGYFRRPYSNIADVTETYNGGMSNYNGLQARIEGKNIFGLWFLNAFTWSRALGNVGDFLTASRGFSGSPTDYYGNSREDYGPLQFDLPIVNITSLTWKIPVGRGRTFLRHANRAVDSVVGGWQIAMYHQFHSGPALTPNFTPSGVNLLTNNGGIQYRPYFASVANLTPAQVRKQAHQRMHIPGHPERAFCDSVYASTAQASYSGCTVMFATTNPYSTGATSTTATTADQNGTANDPRGNVPNGFLRGDSYDSLDASVAKMFVLPFNARLEIRGQFYNVLNKTNFTVPGMTCCSTSFGRITSTYGPGRIGQVQARLNF
ncbi:TonB-dependent receptor [Granulicella cerasi]|uniref:TonB-dependent receptor n=1 Tax=Granulicella cerasi TaxID=741063 RepID=A0ABW1Z8Q0_9BACT|nr:TonB-dependent receptor [Granulicella cerasi]